MRHEPDLRASYLLRLLPPEEMRRTGERVVVEVFAPGDILRAQAIGSFVRFPLTAVFALLATEAGGAGIAVGSVGPEGAGGLNQALGAPAPHLDLVCLVGGSIASLPIAEFRRVLEAQPSFRWAVVRYLGARDVLIAQMAVCNRFHPLDARLARLLLTTNDRIGGRPIPATHELLALLLGVSRPKVSSAMDALRRSGLLATRPGEIRVLDAAGLREVSCPCYEVIREVLTSLHEARAPGP